MGVLLDEGGSVLLDEGGAVLYDEAGATGGGDIVVIETIHWTWVLGGTPPTGVAIRELTKARGRTMTWRLYGPPTAQFTIDGRSDEAAQIAALATDLTVYREADRMFRGRIGPETDDVGPDAHISQFTALGYRSMLAFRQTGIAGARYDAIPGGVIALDLIDSSQAETGGDWGITGGIGTDTGTPRDLTVDAGKPIADSINELAQLDNGFEWEVDADLSLNIWHPRRGSNNGEILDYGGNASRINRLLDPKDFANAGLVTGQEGLNPVPFEAVDLDTDPRGRWETSVGYPTIENQPRLDARAIWLRDQSAVLRPAFTVTLRPGRWAGTSHIWLGDTVLLVIQSGRLAIADTFRVLEVSVQLTEDSTETVTLGLRPS